MSKISESEFRSIYDGICIDKEIILRHNPVGTSEETLLWMLMNCLASYLSLTEIETPCFSGKADASTYRDSITYILKNRKIGNFDESPYLADLVK